jgi:hypothetical protein
MISSEYKRLFGPGGCLTPQALRSYIDGSLHFGSRRLVEEHIKKCRLCSEALGGFKKHGRDKYLESDLAFLSRRVRRIYRGNRYEPDRKLPVMLLISVILLLFILLGIFILVKQDILFRQAGAKVRPDTVINAVKVSQDSSAHSQVAPPEETNPVKR